jgi:hypothetical protein
MLRGIPLPATGTFESKLLAEGIQRERNERFAFAVFLSRCISQFGVPVEKFSAALTEYGEELFQFRYNSKYAVAALKLEEEKVTQERQDRDVLARAMAITTGNTDAR